MKTPTLLFALGLLLAGCTKAPETVNQGECAGPEDCPDGLQCIEAACVEVQCTTSADCPFDTYCDGATYACVDGCQEDTDCLSGYSCDQVANTCVEAACTDTQIDCAVGDLCDPTSRTCVDDTRNHCGDCDALGGGNQCPGGECVAWEVGETCSNDSQCPSGWYCDNFTGYGRVCHKDYCLMTCNPTVANSCPSGFSCGEVYAGDPSTYCVADCSFLTEGGYL